MIGWLDCSAGVSGNMLLGALLDAGASLDRVRAAVRAVDANLDVRLERTQRHQIDAALATVVDTRTGAAADAGQHPHSHSHAPVPAHAHAPVPSRAHAQKHEHPHHHEHAHRSWRGVRKLLDAAALDDAVARRAHGVFARLAEAEGRVHGMPADEVGFHEVGALDAIGDVVGCCAAIADLGLAGFTCSVITLGHGEQSLGEHGRIPIPGPAVLNLLGGVPVTGGPVALEMTTPTGAALVTEFASGYGPMPPLRVARVGLGAGNRDPEGVANLTRLVLGEPIASPDDVDAPLLLETNVDDLDPRLWPGLLTVLLEAGAHDAWLTPILMKKGRPAHTLAALVPASLRSRAIGIIVAHTSTLGVRERTVARHTLTRREETVEVDGHAIGVKVAEHEGAVVNVQPEFEDVAAAARALDLPAKVVLARAQAAADGLWRY